MKTKCSPGSWFLACLFALVATSVAEPSPGSRGEESEHAFRDLAALYGDAGITPPFARALEELSSSEAAKRESAGRYLLALFQQSLADETNGRTEMRKLPLWSDEGGYVARDFRKRLAKTFGEKARGEAALDVVLWLSNQEVFAGGPEAAAKVLPRIDSPRMEKVLADLLVQPHPNAVLAVAAIDEVARRKLTALAPRIRELCGHYRGSVRTAARKAAPRLGLASLPDYKPAEAFSPWLLAQLETLRQMCPFTIPKTAEWSDFEYTNPHTTVDGQPWKKLYSGWLLEEKDKTYEVLTWFGYRVSLAKAETKRTPRKLTDAAREIATLQLSRDKSWERLRGEGELFVPFDLPGMTTPAGLVAAWCIERREREAAATVLFPCFNRMPDDRWPVQILRDQLSHLSQQEMLVAFSYKLDYPRAIALAEHLSQPIFDGYESQGRARELAAQLRARAADFKDFKLPTPEEWATLRATMSLPEQIKYLAARLRLLNCHQTGQPGGVDYTDLQFDRKDGSWQAEGRTKFVNPFVELRAMDLTPADLPVLVPSLADENFLPTFSYWRDFHPGRVLHQVNWLAAQIVNDAAKRKLADMEKYQSLDEAGRKKYLEDISAWCVANATMTHADLLLATLRESQVWNEFFLAAKEAAQNKVPGTAALLVDRAPDFPRLQGEIAHVLYLNGDPAAVGAAREWLASKEDEVRFWAALMLLRDGDKNEGFAELKALLPQTAGYNYYAWALATLLARKEEATQALACSVLRKPGFSDCFSDNGFFQYERLHILNYLLLTGRQEVLDFVTNALDDAKDGGQVFSDEQEKFVKVLRQDNVALWLAKLRNDGRAYPVTALPKERAARRAELKLWLAEQFALLRAGKPATLKNPPPIHVSNGRFEYTW
jgi:hypothetical protein